MMHTTFSWLDWVVLGSYFSVLLATSVLFSRFGVRNTRDYFVGSHSVPVWAAAVSVLATSQSAATFLGGPEYSYAKDLTFLGFYLSAFLGILFVTKVLIPRFYAIDAVTVYELLEKRYGTQAKRDAALMFLVGRLFASGARLYIGALAVSMILFLDIQVSHVAVSIAILIGSALAYAYYGGVKSVIFSDAIQAVTYIGAGLAVAVYLYIGLDTDLVTLGKMLYNEGKLRLVDTSFLGGFSIWSLLSGWLLLNIAAYGLDQDMTQRALTCRNVQEARRSLLFSFYLTVPTAILFLLIGLLLYAHYHGVGKEPDMHFEGDKITVLMYYILHEMPEGLRGLVTVGAVAAALSSSNSVLTAMASVAIEDIYKPWRLQQGRGNEAHFLRASRIAVVLFAALLSAMAMMSYYWQHVTHLPLLSFALSVMAFAYAGLLGVYGAAIFTTRGTQRRVRIALLSGFLTVFMLQPYVAGAVFDVRIPFAWHLTIGTAVAFFAMIITKRK